MLGKQRGGLEQIALEYHHALKSKGHSVKTILRRGAQVAPRPDMDHSYVNLSYWPDLTRRRLMKHIVEFNADIVILHGNRPMKYLGQEKSFPARRIFVAHNFRAKKHIFNVDAVIAVSAPVRDSIVSIGFPSSQAYTVNNMTDMKPITPKSFDQACPVYGMLARLHPVKGTDLFLRALAELKNQGHNFRARIGGDGPEKNALKKLAADLGLTQQIEFLGWVEDKTAFFQSIDILAAPSRSEAFPVLVIEALAAGIPLIVSDLPGPCSVLTANNEALIVPPEDPQALAAALRRLAENGELRRHMVDCQHKTAVNFTPEAIAGRLSETVSSVMSRV